MNPTTLDAYKLLHDGILAFARAEQAGMRIDVEYCERQKLRLTYKMNLLEKEFKQTSFYKHWEHIFGAKTNTDSNWQLAHILYTVKKIKPAKTTASGKGSTDEDALSQLDIPEIKSIMQSRKLKKLRDTYLDSFIREQVDGYIHPFFNLHTVRTYRSCVAKGSKVMAIRNFLEYREGVPIEQIKAGDYVYCFDDNLRPAIRKVLWAGKTGHREVVRVHWRGAKGNTGFLDVTPEHLVRHISGKYVQAKNLIGDMRTFSESKHAPLVRVLSCHRLKDRLYFTGFFGKDGVGLAEHRFIYSQMIGFLRRNDKVHHKNGKHFDHCVENLEKISAAEHARLHTTTRWSRLSSEDRLKYIRILREAWQGGLFQRKGTEHPSWLGLTKWQCLKLISQYGGKIALIAKDGQVDFNTFKKYLQIHQIDPKVVKLRYDRHGLYISKGRLKRLHSLGRAKVSSELGHNYYKLLKLYKLYELDPSRRWGNQFGTFVVNNHEITNVEWINKAVDVYDIEVEDYHNFIANEICVHNSSDRPNFQNIPKRDEEAMNICRRAIFPRPGHQLVEVDYSSIEVKISTCHHKDPVMLKYMTDPTSDMHRDMAIQIFKLNLYDKTKVGHYQLRQAAKNGFVFPQFYGDYYGNCAENMACGWCKLPKGEWRLSQGIEFIDGYISDHLISVGIKSFDKFEEHVKAVEEDFWDNRFKVYQQWKDRWWAEYQRNGYFDLLTGFRCSGLMKKNDASNYPIQGAAFHCLLWSFIEIDRIQREEKWDSRLIGQIHDAIVLDIHPLEMEHVMKTVKRVTCVDLPRKWPWIIVPLDVEAEVCKVDRPWNTKKAYKIVS